MKIEGIYFLSVPFDNTYRNVMSAIDRYGEFIEDFKNTLLYRYVNSYANIFLMPTHIKNVRRNELFVSFNININSSIDLLDYNYAIIINGEEKSFWFINRLEQQNGVDNINNYNIMLECDVWSNYQNLIYTEPRLQPVEYMHIKQNQIKDGKVVPIDNLPICEMPDKIDYYQKDLDIKGFDVLWAKVEISGAVFANVRIKGVDNVRYALNPDWNQLNSGQLYGSTTFNTVFIPVIVRRKNSAEVGWEIDNFSIYKVVDRENKEIILSTGGLNLSNVVSDIVAISYTFYPPFYYEVYKEAGNNVVKVDAWISDEIQNKNSVNLFNRSLCCVVNASTVYTPSDYYRSNCIEIDVVKDEYFTEYSPNIADFYNENFNFNLMIKTQPLLHRYPFEKLSIMLGQQSKIDHIPKEYNESVFVRVQPSVDGVRYQFIDGSIEHAYEPYNTNLVPQMYVFDNFLPFTNSQKEVFLRNNSAKLSASKNERLATINLEKEKAAYNVATAPIRALPSIVESVGKGDYSSAAGSAVSSLISPTLNAIWVDKESEVRTALVNEQYSAQLTDITNSKEIASNPQGGENDICIQDRVIVLHSIMALTEKTKAALWDIHRYGYRVNRLMDITKFPMNTFVYLKTIDSSLTSKVNFIIKQKLEAILNKGVRCWKILNENSKEMSLNTNNPENLEANL